MNEIRRYMETSPQLTKAVVGYFIKDGKVLLGVREKVSHGLGEKIVAGIGGKVEEGESYEQAFVREVREEIGILATRFDRMGRVVFLFPHKPKWNMDVIVFVVHEWEGEPQVTDVITPGWYSPDQLPADQMWEDNLLWVPKVLAGEHIHATFMYGEDGKIVEHYFED